MRHGSDFTSLPRNVHLCLSFLPWSWVRSHKNNPIMSGHIIMSVYLEIACWPPGVPSGTRMRSWSPVSGCWLRTPPPPGSGAQNQKINNSILMLGGCNYPHYLLVDSVIIAGVSSSFSSIQCGYPVRSFRQNHGEDAI